MNIFSRELPERNEHLFIVNIFVITNYIFENQPLASINLMRIRKRAFTITLCYEFINRLTPWHVLLLHILNDNIQQNEKF